MESAILKDSPLRGPQRPKVVLVGGGFGGLYAAQRLRGKGVDVTLIDRRNFHLFQPLLYQVATGTLSPADISSPLRHVLAKQKNARVLLAEVRGFDVSARKVLLDQGEEPYDYLVIAAGASHNYFGHDWDDLAPGLKTIEDATRIRRRIFAAFEAAERTTDVAERKALLTFVIAGGGPTGVELAGALAEISRNTLRGEFRTIDPASAKIILVEGSPHVLSTFTPELGDQAQRALEKLGVDVRTGCKVIDVTPGLVVVEEQGVRKELTARTVLWGAGVQASPLAKALSKETGVELDRVGKVMVEPDCSIAGHPEIFVIGDMSHYKHQGGGPLPGVAQTAMQQGHYVADLIAAVATGKDRPSRPFRYINLGNMATIGRGSAIFERGSVRLAGFFAWLGWLFIHVLNLVEYENRVLVFLQWGWSFFTWNRSARLITGESKPPPALLSAGDAPKT